MTTPAAKQVEGGLRSDPGPLTKRFEALGTPESVAWFSGTTGDASVPGPTTYWIDAVVHLAPDTTARLLGAMGTGVAATPVVFESLTGSVPAGDYLTSPGLDLAFAQGQWRGTAYLDPKARVLVLVALGGS